MHLLPVLRDLAARGVSVSTDGETIRVRPKSATTSAELATIREHKPAVLKLMGRGDDARYCWNCGEPAVHLSDSARPVCAEHYTVPSESFVPFPPMDACPQRHRDGWHLRHSSQGGGWICADCAAQGVDPLPYRPNTSENTGEQAHGHEH